MVSYDTDCPIFLEGNAFEADATEPCSCCTYLVFVSAPRTPVFNADNGSCTMAVTDISPLIPAMSLDTPELSSSKREADALELLAKTSNSNSITLFLIMILAGSTHCHFQSPVLSITLQTVESLLRHMEGTDRHVPGICLLHGDPLRHCIDVAPISTLFGSIILLRGLAPWLWIVDDTAKGVLVQPG